MVVYQRISLPCNPSLGSLDAPTLKTIFLSLIPLFVGLQVVILLSCVSIHSFINILVETLIQSYIQSGPEEWGQAMLEMNGVKSLIHKDLILVEGREKM